MNEGVTSEGDCELTILMPCLNEAETLGTCIEKSQSFLDRNEILGEILIADNGSSDGSQAIARAACARVVPVATRGYGAAVIEGIAQAHGRYIIMGDADDSYDFTKLEEFVTHLRSGSDLVMGNRFLGGIEPGAMPFLHRHLGNPVLSFIGRLFFNLKVGDFHCGLRGFRAEPMRALGLNTTGMEFASEMLVRAAMGGLTIAEVPTTLKRHGRSRAPHLKTWRDGWRHLKFLLIFSPRWLYIIPGLVAVVLGAALSAVLFFGPVRLRSVALDLNAFITSCLIIVAGVQMLSFGALSRLFAASSGLLPNSPRVISALRHATTDRLVLVAGGLILGGTVLFFCAFQAWAAVDFGNLSSSTIPRLVIVALALVLIGLQTFFSAFFLCILAIPTQRNGECGASAHAEASRQIQER